MALADSYADVQDYSAAVNRTSAEENVEIQGSLDSASRHVDYLLGLSDGAFQQTDANVVRFFNGNGQSEFRLRDDRGRVNPIATIDSEGIAVDTGLDDAFATTFDTSDSWVLAQPYQAPELSEPWTSLRLIELVGASASVGELLRAFPTGFHNVRLTGTWGWASVPEAIKALTIKIARDMRDSLLAGPSGDLQLLEGVGPVASDTWRLWRAVEDHYSHRIPAVA